MKIEKTHSNSPERRLAWVLIFVGTLLNLAAVITDGNSGSLVAVGCSLLAIGVAKVNGKKQEG